MRDALRTCLQIAGGLTEATRRRTVDAARELLDQTGIDVDAVQRRIESAIPAEVQTLADELMATGRANRDLLLALIREEVDKAMGRVGRVADEVTKVGVVLETLERRIRNLESTGADEPAPKPAPSEPAPPVQHVRVDTEPPAAPRKTAAKEAPPAKKAAAPAAKKSAPAARKPAPAKKATTAGPGTAKAAAKKAAPVKKATSVARKSAPAGEATTAEPGAAKAAAKKAAPAAGKSAAVKKTAAARKTATPRPTANPTRTTASGTKKTAAKTSAAKSAASKSAASKTAAKKAPAKKAPARKAPANKAGSTGGTGDE